MEDLQAGVDHVVKMGVADPDRLGVGGWSYGGILTDYMIASDTRFKAATSGAGTAFTVAFYGTDQYIIQYDYEIGPPWNPKAWETYQKISYPFLHADRIKTPTLFLGGERDFNVPVQGSQQMYQALRSLGIDTQLDDLSERDPRHQPPELRAGSSRALPRVVRQVRQEERTHDDSAVAQVPRDAGCGSRIPFHSTTTICPMYVGVVLVQMIVEPAGARLVQRAGGAALAGIEVADLVDRRAVRVRGHRIRRDHVRAGVLVDERHVRPRLDLDVLRIDSRRSDRDGHVVGRRVGWTPTAAGTDHAGSERKKTRDTFLACLAGLKACATRHLKAGATRPLKAGATRPLKAGATRPLKAGATRRLKAHATDAGTAEKRGSSSRRSSRHRSGACDR